MKGFLDDRLGLIKRLVKTFGLRVKDKSEDNTSTPYVPSLRKVDSFEFPVPLNEVVLASCPIGFDCKGWFFTRYGELYSFTEKRALVKGTERKVYTLTMTSLLDLKHVYALQANIRTASNERLAVYSDENKRPTPASLWGVYHNAKGWYQVILIEAGDQLCINPSPEALLIVSWALDNGLSIS